MLKQNAKSPAEIAKMFGCTEAQARNHIEMTIKDLHAMAEKAKASKTGKLRGFSAEWYEERANAFLAELLQGLKKPEGGE